MKISDLTKPLKNLEYYSLFQIFVTVGLFVLSLLVLLDTPILLKKIEVQAAAKSQAFVQLPLSSSQNVAGIEKAPVVKIVGLNLIQPQFSAQAVLAKDLDTGELIFQKNIHERLAPASTTKLMTALVALDYYKPDDVLTVYPGSLVEGSTMGLKLNERLTFTSLLYGMLLNSGNDAAYTFALNYPGGFTSFIGAMNQKALALGLSDTHFANPAGFDDPSHFSSAYDLNIIATEAIKNPMLAKIVDTKAYSVASLNNPESTTSSQIIHPLENVNKLLSEPGVIGIKTGYTEKAGENLVGLVDRENHKIITVVLDSADRFGETKTLMNWLYQDYRWTVQ